MIIRILIAAVVAVVAVAGGLLYYKYQHYEGIRTVREIVVSAPPDQVWRQLSDPGKRPDWIRGLVSVVAISGTPGTKGAKSWLIFMRQGNRFKVQEEILDAEPGAWLGLQTESAASVLTTTFTLERVAPADQPDEIGTRITFEQDTTHLTWQGKFLAPFMATAAAKNADRDLQKLKQIVENPDQT